MKRLLSSPILTKCLVTKTRRMKVDLPFVHLHNFCPPYGAFPLFGSQNVRASPSPAREGLRAHAVLCRGFRHGASAVYSPAECRDRCVDFVVWINVDLASFAHSFPLHCYFHRPDLEYFLWSRRAVSRGAFSSRHSRGSI